MNQGFLVSIKRSFLVTAALCCVAVASADGGGIAISNPGFEQLEPGGGVVGWRLVDGESSDGATFTGDGASAYGGVGSARVAVQGHGIATVESDPVTLKVGKLYRLSGWVRTEGAVSDPMAKYPTAVPACLSMKALPFTIHSPAVGGDSDWTRVDLLFIAISSSDRIRLHLGHNGTARGAAWFDDLRLERVADIAEYIPPETVRWSGDGFRYDDQGWIFIHIEGEPYERGYQYGSLMPDEIVEYIRKLGVLQYGEDPESGWDTIRFEADALFLRKYDEEYLTEMRGIADGAAAAGGEAWGRPIDLRDIVALNSVVDLGQLEDALEVTPNSLTGQAFEAPEAELDVESEQHKCSAFVATGPATRDGQVVFGQIFMWGGFTGVHWNVITDIVPSEGYRLVFHTFPGGIHSGADFYLNEAGIAFGETTVMQTPYEADSTPQSNRARKAAQYAASIDDVERILWEKNNGMYTNDWPIADFRTGEVAILLLGTHEKKLWRTSEDMNPFGTPGFLWANNNNRDPEVRKEYVAQPDDRPFDLMFSPWNRDLAFNEFYRENKGAIDANAGVRLWASSPINRAHACDGKITTTEMAGEMVFLAHHGKVTLREKFPTKGWRYLPDLPGAVPHLSLGYSVVSPVFIADQLKAARQQPATEELDAEEAELELGDLEDQFRISKKDLWRGTIEPASPAESWFVSATAAYWRMLDGLDDDDPVAAAEKLAEELAGIEARYLYTASREEELAAIDAHRAYDRYGPYLLPRIKGTFALHQLRLLLGNEVFFEVMTTVHDRFRGREMSTEEFLAVAEEVSGRGLASFMGQWLHRTGLPRVQPRVEVRKAHGGGWNLTVGVEQRGELYHFVTHLEVEAGGERSIHRVEVVGKRGISLRFDERPTRVVFDALHDLPVEHGSFYEWRNFIDDFHDILIVYGTARQIEANHTMARRWQERVADTYIEILLPLVKDAELGSDRAADHDLMVMGTLDDNRFFGAVPGDVPVRFGRDHFEWKGEIFGEPDDGLFLVLPNPSNPEKVMYVLAANSGMELYHMTETYHRGIPQWARFKGGKIVDSGYFDRPGFVIDLSE
ncbi:MAG: C45 family autoproteolytic acyltransferase/hydrolase [Thermoanaerobaculales bacterium]